MIFGPWNLGFQDLGNALEFANFDWFRYVGYFSHSVYVKKLDFLTQNLKISSFLKTSKNFLEHWILPGSDNFFANFDVLGINST